MVYVEKRGQSAEYDWRHKFTISIDERFGREAGALIYQRWNDIINDAVGPAGRRDLTFMQRISVDAATDHMKTKIYLESITSQLSGSDNHQLKIDVLDMKDSFERAVSEGRDDIAVMYAAKNHAKTLVDTLEYHRFEGFSPDARRKPFNLMEAARVQEAATAKDPDMEFF